MDFNEHLEALRQFISTTAKEYDVSEDIVRRFVKKTIRQMAPSFEEMGPWKTYTKSPLTRRTKCK